MPLNNGKQTPVCINHPDEEMVLIQSTKVEQTLHILLMGTQSNDNPITYDGIPEATAMNLYACKQCGYCEKYLAEHELQQIQTP